MQSISRLVLASGNPGKLREIGPLLEGLPFDVATLSSWPTLRAPDETGATFAENARAKALYKQACDGGDGDGCQSFVKLP